MFKVCQNINIILMHFLTEIVKEHIEVNLEYITVNKTELENPGVL